MRRRHSLLIAALPAILMGALALPALGQDKEADKAKALLRTGIAQYTALQFREAKASLLKVNPEALSDADRRLFHDHLSRVDAAIRGQLAARETLRAAQQALKANQLKRARELFAQVAACQYLPRPIREDAARQASLAARKLQAAKRAAKEKPPMPAVVLAAAPARPRPDVPPNAPQPRPIDAAEAKQAEARRLLAAARKAMDDNRPAKAAQLLRQVLQLDPGLEEAKKDLRFAEGLLGVDHEPPALTRLERRQRIARQRTDLEINKFLGQSNEILARTKPWKAAKAEDFKAAANAAQMAMDVLATNKELYTEKSYRDWRTRIENQFKYVNKERDKWRKLLAEDNRKTVLKIEEDRLADEAEQKRRKIDMLRNQARALMAGRRFGQALEEVERILKLDPKNRWAGEQKETLSQFVMLMEHKGVVKTRDTQTQLLLIDIKRSEIPWWKEITYPEDWRELTARRLKHGVTAAIASPEDRRVRQRLKETIRELNFDEVELEDVIQFLRDVSGVNIYVKWPALAAAGISRTTTVSIRLTEVTLEKALRIVLDDVGAAAPLGFVVDAGVITISTRDDLSTKTITRVYDIRDLIIRIPNFRGRRLDMTSEREFREEEEGLLEPGIGVGVGLEGEGRRAEEEEDLSMQEVVDNMIELIKTTIAPDTWANTNEVGLTEMRGQLVITQTAENHQKIVDLLGQLREARALQVSIEARFIQIQQGFLERIGVELDLIINAGDTTAHRVAGCTERVAPLIIGSEGTGGAHGLGDLITWAHELGGSQVGLDIAGDTAAVPTALSICGSWLDDIQVSWLVQATQADARSRVLTAPRLTLFNGQRAFVAVTRELTYVSEFELTTSPVIGTADVVRQEIDIETDILRTGTLLDVRATVSDDRRYVTLTLRPQVSTGDTTPFIVRGGDPEAGTEFETTMQLPDLTVSEIQTSVSVPDGGTVLLGGLKRAAETEREIGVPLVNKVPILNRLFTNQGLSRDNDTLLILVKPKIIIQREEEELAFP